MAKKKKEETKSEKKLGECPNPDEFLKWFEKRAAQNANTRPDIVELARVIPIVATELQINNEYNLITGDPEDGAVLEKLTGCGFPVEVFGYHPDEGFVVQYVEGQGPKLK